MSKRWSYYPPVASPWWEAPVRLYQPAHVVCVDRAHRRVVVAFSVSRRCTRLTHIRL